MDTQPIRGALLFILLITLSLPARADNSLWDNQFGYAGIDPSGTVYDIAVDGSDVYIAGFFYDVTDVTDVRGIARWDGSAWHRLSSGVYPGTIRSIAISGPSLYATGNFTSAGGTPADNVAMWDGSSWSALGAGLTAPGLETFAIAVFGGDVYVGGTATAGGFLARWNGAGWSDLSGAFSPDDSVTALTADGSYLYVGGDFATAGGLAAGGAARWDGSSWSTMGSGFAPGGVLALASDGGQVYASARFVIPNLDPIAIVSEWDGSSWTTLGNATSPEPDGPIINDIYASGGTLAIAGEFDAVAGVPANQVAVWDGASWSGNTGGDVSYYGASAVAVKSGDVYAGAHSSDVAGTGATGVARWDGAQWYRMSNLPTNGMQFYVDALAINGDGHLVAGGQFTTAGDVPVDYLAVFDGSTWSELGGGVNGYVNCLLADGSVLYVGGNFTEAGSTPVSKVAAWDGSSWDDLGGGIAGGAYALAMYDGDLIVGGNCYAINGCTLGHVVRWDGASWSGLGTLQDGSSLTAFALHEHDGDLYVGGNFGAVDGVTASRIARWDGVDWWPVGGGFDESVLALATYNGELYAGGIFRNSGATQTRNIARWDGMNWVEVGGGVLVYPNQSVKSLCAFGPSLYAGGSFSTIGSVYAQGVARWDGYAWHALGSGTWDGSFAGVRQVAVTDACVWVGGSFRRAGGKYSRYIGRYLQVPTGVAEGDVPAAGLQLGQNAPNPFNPGTTIRYTIAERGPVSLRIYDVRGRLVRTMTDKILAPDHYTVTWDGKDDGGRGVPSGVYFYRLEAGGKSASRRMVLLK